MVEVEIRVPRHDEEVQSIEWERLALVRADPEGVEVYGDASCVPDDSVINIISGKRVDMASCPEVWARNLPYAYRSGDLVAVVVHDDDPVLLEPDDAIEEPVIPEPPVSEITNADQPVGV